ncbi:atlastin-like [Bombyx mandarina]|uniref:Atlastin-like n=1 Tax=Bombyx mandarina TaxID=7092 RepID=A0A6J2JL01_BOMMA|nr:atlastin-like [Bombyx mandarina]
MSSLGEAKGVEVVKVTDDHTYQLNEDALRMILLRDEVKDLPVVVVSVAGVYRGGKSFLLDFFLRYLKAPPSSRDSAAWLGQEDEPLTGFIWRAGCDRQTTGIVLWSEPIVTRFNDQKVAVVLMDTQGTFDNSSTVRDSSTIFALSTLLSSIQIYNLKENIKEDDLQHLHLFTEYGRLACDDDDEAAFQVLMFLVRDWAYPYQHAFGAEGGEELLIKRLQITNNQHAELRELRERIRSCFKSVSCFLMPHPGFVVSEQNFNGQLADIRIEFKEALRDLVPSMFGSRNLVPKKINGHQIKTRDLFDFFKTYVNIYNSEELPTPVTILKATSEVALISAIRDAREQYEKRMEMNAGAKQPSVPDNVLEDQHKRTVLIIRQSFESKKRIGSQKDAKEHIEKLITELEARLQHYLTLNKAKLQKAVVDAKQAYDDAVQKVTKGEPLCLHPLDLDSLHNKAVDAAADLFDNNRRTPDKESDPERISLMKHLEGNIKDLRLKNDYNNKVFISEARKLYETLMQKHVCMGSCVSDELLQNCHRNALKKAIGILKSHRNIPTNHSEDKYISSLQESIVEEFQKFRSANNNANKIAIQAAVYSYNNHMTSAWGPPSSCFHPQDLTTIHETNKALALTEFHNSRNTTADYDGDDGDVNEQKLVELLSRRYSELKEINSASNDMAVADSYREYCRYMDGKCKPSVLSILIVPWLVKVIRRLPDYHKEGKNAAWDYFRSKRRNYSYRSDDSYRTDLESKLEDGFHEYCHPLNALTREFGI